MKIVNLNLIKNIQIYKY